MSNIIELSRKLRIEETIEVDGELVTLRVDGAFDTQKGTYRVTPVRTTKTVSYSPETNKAIAQRMQGMTDAMIEHCEDLREQVQQGNDDEGPTLFDQLDQDHEMQFESDEPRQIDFETGDFVEEPVKRGRKARAQVAADDGDGGTDDELYPGI